MKERLLQINRSRNQTGFHQFLPTTLDNLAYLDYRYIYERPSNTYRKRLSRLVSNPNFQEHTKQLIEEGVLILSSYFSNNVVKEMSEDFNKICASKLPEAKGLTHIDGAIGESYLSASKALSLAVVDPYLTALASYYWGKPIKLAYARGYRTEPIFPEEYRAFQWHHDLKRKQIKVMILLTDVPSNGQRMDYIPGTHRIWHKFKSQKDTVFSKDQALEYGDPIPCSGSAGTVIIFDTNGLHRGNRNLGPRRDQYTVNYTGGKSIFPLPGLHPEVIQTLNGREKRMARIGESEKSLRGKIQRIKGYLLDSYLLRSW